MPMRYKKPLTLIGIRTSTAFRASGTSAFQQAHTLHQANRSNLVCESLRFITSDPAAFTG